MAVQVAIIERMDDPDKDIRFMAASDCLRDLVNDSLKLDEDLERRVSAHFDEHLSIFSCSSCAS